MLFEAGAASATSTASQATPSSTLLDACSSRSIASSSRPLPETDPGDGHRLAHLARPVERREQRPIVEREWEHLPGPMSYSAAMYHTGKNPLRPVKRDSEEVATVKTPQERRLHKAFLRYHDPANFPRTGRSSVRHWCAWAGET